MCSRKTFFFCALCVCLMLVLVLQSSFEQILTRVLFNIHKCSVICLRLRRADESSSFIDAESELLKHRTLGAILLHPNSGPQQFGTSVHSSFVETAAST